ncbi:hypothetical protein [Micromonospora sp. RTGN7]|uniref:hypothetical protein n=1 Tax=Micromonospora sp. RTGN7 TaxID=3016526 RepID=UPI0029FEC9EA|nr:hypothetical protein [Micromonospora sp. RTGN7]
MQPIFFRLIRVRTDWITYDRWIWLDGYQLDAKGEAVAQRTIFVQPAGLVIQPEPPIVPAGPTPPGRQRARRTTAPAVRPQSPAKSSRST